MDQKEMASMGGLARAAKLTKAKRKAIAKMAGCASAKAARKRQRKAQREAKT